MILIICISIIFLLPILLILFNHFFYYTCLIVFFISIDFHFTFPLFSIFNISLSYSSFLCFLYWLGVLINRKSIFLTNLKKQNFSSIKFLLIILFLYSLFNLNHNYASAVDKYTLIQIGISPVIQKYNVLFWVLSAFLFVKIVEREILLNKKRFLIAGLCFCLPVILHFLVNNINIFNVFKNQTLTESIYLRSSGLFSDYELLVDYLFFVLFFSLLIVKYGIIKLKYIPKFLIFFSLVVGIQTGDRSFYFMLILWPILFSIFYFIYNKKYLFIVTLFITIPLLYIYIDNFFIKIIDLLNLQNLISFRNFTFDNTSNLDSFFNRKFSDIPSLLNEIPFLGVGPFYLWKFNDNDIVSHNLFLHFYFRFGFFIFLLFVFLSIKYYKSILFSYKCNPILNSIFSSFVFLLFFSQMKVSFIRNVNSIFIYIFILIYVYTILKNFQSFIVNSRND